MFKPVHTVHAITNLLQPCDHSFNEGDLVWFTKDDKNWMLGKVKELSNKQYYSSPTDRLPAKTWEGFYIENNKNVVSEIFTPMTGRAKPNVARVRSLLVSEGHLHTVKEAHDKVNEFTDLWNKHERQPGSVNSGDV